MVKLRFSKALARDLFFVVVFVLVVVLAMPVLNLTARNEVGELCYQMLVRPGNQFTIRFTHSVAKRPVDETFEITPKGQIMLTETTYDSFGAGLPFEPYQDQHFAREPGRFKMRGYHYIIPTLVVRVGRFADHRFIAGEKNVPLSAWTQPGRPVVFTVERTRIYQYLYQEVDLRWKKNNKMKEQWKEQ